MSIFKKIHNVEKIKFIAESEHVWEVRQKPFPASKALPQWWKNIPIYSSDSNKFEMNPGPTVTVKRCLSAYDGISAGYIFSLWADILVEYDEQNGTVLKWGTQEPIFDIWANNQVGGYEIPENNSLPVFKYLHGWFIKTPPGWSSLIIHPVGYQNLPFKVISGIVDTDKLDTGINTPLSFKKGFTGIVEKGTPIFQVIPIKRAEWQSEFSLQDEKTTLYNLDKLRSTLISSYNKNLRDPKKYN